MVPQKTYLISVHTRTPRRRFEVRSVNDVAIARCVGTCYLNLPSGDYKAVYYDATEHPHELSFAVDGSAKIEITDANESAASTGLVLGIAGPLLAVTGFVLMIEGVRDSCLGLMGECYNQKSPDGTLMLGGLLALAAGAVATPVGWVMYSHNRTPRLEQSPLSIRVAVAPTRNGGFVGISGQF